VPVLVMRDKTERPEGVEEGFAKLVGTTRQSIVEQTACVLDHGSFVSPEKRGLNPYGDGKAAQRIVSVLLSDGKRQE